MAHTEPLSPRETLDYLLELGQALLSAGCSIWRLEELLTAVAKRQGAELEVFAVPTGLFLTLKPGGGEAPLMSMVRLSQWGTDLELLAALDELVNEVADGVESIPAARARIRALTGAPPRWPTFARLLAGMGVSAGSVVSFGGSSWTDSLLAGVGGGLLALLLMRTRRKPSLRVLENFLGGLVAGGVALAATLLWPGHSRDALVLAVIVPLLPGLTLTTGLIELTHRNLVTGSSRVLYAGVVLLSLAFGIAAMVALESYMGLAPGAAAPREAVAPWWHALALAVTAVSIGVLVGVKRKDLRIAVASCALVWVSGWVAKQTLSDLGPFAVAFALAAASNAWARMTSRPAQLFLVPGLWLLVPGALGFRGLDALLRGDVVAGGAQLSSLLLVSGALVTGLLVANAAVPPQKVL